MKQSMTVYAADCVNNPTNCHYPHEIVITDEATAKEALSKDIVCAKYKNDYRSIENFMWTNTLPMDCDNDHSDNEAEWLTAEAIADIFSDVTYILHFSRNHMKQKGAKTPRPRFHILFLIDRTDREAEYSGMKERVIAEYPFFDDGAKDTARFLFGTKYPQVIFHEGRKTINAYLDDLDTFSEMDNAIISEGSRNSTISRIGAKIIKRYGDTNFAHEQFLKAAERCSPPLDDDELSQIWRGKQKFYKILSSQPGYVPPEQYNGTEPIAWETPIPFEDYELPAFPTEALPQIVRNYVLAVAESTQTSADMAAVEALGVVSLCVQGKYFIRGNADWGEPLNTYTVVILPPAERKSSVLAMMTFPVEKYENETNIIRNAQIVESNMVLDKLKKEKRDLVERASKGKATEAEVSAKAAEIAAFQPVKPLRLFVDDVTSEKLTSVLAENNGRAAVVSAEGGIFDIISGLYTKNVNIDVFLKGHSGDTIRVDRIGRASESIMHPALTMVLAVQPEVLNGLMSNNTFRGRGLTARFLYSLPKSSVGRRTFRSTAIPEKVKGAYEKLITDLLGDSSENEPLELSAEASTVLEELFNEVESRLSGDLAEIPDWAGKFVGAVLRIAGLLHLMESPGYTLFSDVSADTMKAAVQIGRYFLDHAKAAYSLMGADTVNKNAQYLLSAITKAGLSEFSKRDAMRLCRRFKTADALQPVLNRLCEYGYIAPKPCEAPLTYGRKPSEVYLANPVLFQ